MKDQMVVPDYFGELTGWRKFNLRSHGRLLVSANHPIPWTAIDMGAAVCIADPGQLGRHPDSEPCPCQSCLCGYYAYKEKADALAHGQGVVLAKVALWGRLVEHERGYRAERLKIVELFVPTECPQSYVDGLHARYQIPVSISEEMPWTSGNPFGSSPSNPSQNQFQNLQLSQLQAYGQLQAFQGYQNVYQHALGQMNATPIQRVHYLDAMLSPVSQTYPTFAEFVKKRTLQQLVKRVLGI